MEYENKNIGITLSARSDPATSLTVTSETGMHTTDESMELSYGAQCVQKVSLCPVLTEHMYTLTTWQDTIALSAPANSPL